MNLSGSGAGNGPVVGLTAPTSGLMRAHDHILSGDSDTGSLVFRPSSTETKELLKKLTLPNELLGLVVPLKRLCRRRADGDPAVFFEERRQRSEIEISTFFTENDELADFLQCLVPINDNNNMVLDTVYHTRRSISQYARDFINAMFALSEISICDKEDKKVKDFCSLCNVHQLSEQNKLFSMIKEFCKGSCHIKYVNFLQFMIQIFNRVSEQGKAAISRGTYSFGIGNGEDTILELKKIREQFPGVQKKFPLMLLDVDFLEKLKNGTIKGFSCFASSAEVVPVPGDGAGTGIIYICHLMYFGHTTTQTDDLHDRHQTIQYFHSLCNATKTLL